MRTTLFFPALIAVALAGGSALAEKPTRGVPDRLRARGDMVDKSYRGTPDRVAKAAPPAAARGPLKPDHGGSRVSCSDSGVDCAAQRGAAGSAAIEGKSDAGAKSGRIPPFLEKIIGGDRTRFNEAGEDQGMSTRAAKRAWSNAGAPAAAEAPRGAEAPRSGAEQRASVGVPAPGTRMACNEAGECMMSSKAAKKEWAYQAVRAGTWSGPEAKQETPAAHAIAEAKKAEAKADPQKR